MDLDRDLNPEQRAAVLHGDGPLLILAGAGSGKTRVITYRIAHLVRERGVPPSQILAVTFTNKAAGELRERIDGLVHAGTSLWAMTFHAFGARLLRREAQALGLPPDFCIYDADDQRRLARHLLRELDLDPELYKPEQMLERVERAKRNLRGLDNTDLLGPERSFFQAYQAALRRASALDFADLLFLPNRLFAERPDVTERYRGRFRYVLVDEFQDTDFAQFSLLRHLCPDDANLTVVGDDDQSIYEWRGAQVTHILNFRRYYPTAQVVTLERNYRSTGNILEAANQVIAENPRRHPKRLWTACEAGCPVRLLAAADELEEAHLVGRAIAGAVQAGRPLASIAVLYRQNAQSRVLEEGLRRFAIPYRVVGGVRFFDRAEVRDAIAYLRLIQNPRSDIDLLRIMNTPPRGIGDSTRALLVSEAERLQVSLLTALADERLPPLRARERKAVLDFRGLLEGLIKAAAGRSLEELVELVIEQTGYAGWLREKHTDEAAGRLENLEELKTAASEFEAAHVEPEGSALQAFLEHVALITDIDLANGAAEAVSLMTLHSAKGLEFDLVLLTGLEEGLLPHWRSIEPQEDAQPTGGVEEERRLFYVGMTRARQELWLLHAAYRSLAGRSDRATPSRFLADLPGVRPARAVCDDHALDDDDGFLEPPPPRPPTARWSERSVEYGGEYCQEEGVASFAGREVQHPSYGRGRVCEVEPSPQGEKLLIRFPSGLKKILARFVRVI